MLTWRENETIFVADFLCDRHVKSFVFKCKHDQCKRKKKWNDEMKKNEFDYINYITKCHY
jgi:hypothetical protein